MLNTFDNAERQHLRRLEREKHIHILDSITSSDSTFQLPLGSDNTSPVVDALAGEPLARPQSEDPHVSEHQSRLRWWRNNKRLIIIILVVVALIAVTFTFGFDFGENAESKKDAQKDAQTDAQDSPPIHEDDLRRYNKIFSHILDWGVTQRDVLENVSSAPARALHWLSYDDSMVLKHFESGMSAETIRTRYALATLYFSTQKASFLKDAFSESSWEDKTLWLTGFSVCQWFGVECMEDEFGMSSFGRVKDLNLSANGLQGELPDELGLLQLDIRTLDVSDNAIGGTIPESISDLKNLSKCRAPKTQKLS